jgi:hypothetical protein
LSADGAGQPVEALSYIMVKRVSCSRPPEQRKR